MGMQAEETAAEWIKDFTADNGSHAGETACRLAESLRSSMIGLDVIRLLMQQLNEDSRACVAWALQETTCSSGLDALLPAVFEGLNDPAPSVRYWSVLALRQVSGKRRVEAIVHAFSLLEDESDGVRRAAADVIQMRSTRMIGRPLTTDSVVREDFVVALNTDPVACGLTGNRAAKVSQIQSQLRVGYGASELTSNNNSVGGVAQVGYGIRLAQHWVEVALQVDEALHTLVPDVRAILMNRAAELLVTTMDAIESLAMDSDAVIRMRSWRVLSDVMSRVSEWRQQIPVAANDIDNRVRTRCFSNLTYGVASELISTVTKVCHGLADEDTCVEALKALRSMVEEAAEVAGVDSDFLQALMRGLDNPNLSDNVRIELLLVLQSYAKVFKRSTVGISWDEISTRVNKEMEQIMQGEEDKATEKSPVKRDKE